MHLRFTNLRRPKSASELSASECEQVRVAGKKYDLKNLPAELRFRRTNRGPTGFEDSFDDELAMWDVYDGDRHAYDVYILAYEWGSVFPHGKTKPVGDMTNGLFWASKSQHPGLEEALIAGYYEAREEIFRARNAEKKAAKKAARQAAKQASGEKTTKRAAVKQMGVKKTAKQAAAKKATKKARSEERRVGKECRSRGSPEHEEKKEVRVEQRG